MLTSTRFNQAPVMPVCDPADNKYSRNLKEDMKKAFDLFIAFKEELEKLHPDCAYIIENMLQKPQNRF